MVQGEIKGKELDDPTQHRGVVKVAQGGELSIEPVVCLIIPQFDEPGNKGPGSSRQDDQQPECPDDLLLIIHQKFSFCASGCRLLKLLQ